MRRYAIKFRAPNGESEEETVVAANEKKARQAFAIKQPEVPFENIEEVLAASDIRPRVSNATATQKKPDAVNEDRTEDPPLGTEHVTKEPNNGAGDYAPVYLHADYNVARIFSKLLEFIGWATAIFGLFYGIDLVEKVNEVYGGLIIFGSLAGGITLVIIGQASRAVVDNANNTRAILSVLERRLK